MFGFNSKNSAKPQAAAAAPPSGARIAEGSRLPIVMLGEFVGGTVGMTSTADLFSGKNVAIIGLPGAFTPICSELHLPAYIEMAPSLLAAGFDMIACIAANDPWTLAVWARQMDPEGHLRFFSDGNLAFGRACGPHHDVRRSVPGRTAAALQHDRP